MEDREIVQLYWDRNEQAIVITAKKYGNYCTVIARNILGNDEDAEECVNDTWLSAWNAIPPHRPGVLSAFLGKLTRNLSFNKYKYNTADKRGGGQVPLVLEELSECVAGCSDIEQELQHKELAQAINDFLGMLPVDKRKLFVCRYWYTDSISEIAARFDLTEGAVAMSLGRIRVKLHGFLAERGFEL